MRQKQSTLLVLPWARYGVLSPTLSLSLHLSPLSLMSVFMWVSAHVGVCAPACESQSEVGIRYLFQLFFKLFFETGSLAEAGAHQ